MFEITRSKIESDRISDYVALANLLDDKANSFHAAFVISYDGSLFEFHYPGPDQEIEFKILNGDYFHKISDTILPEEVPAFIALCKNIKKNANPKYGFFYSGESYDIDGIHLSSKEIGEVMTCVGFCINVLKGFHEEDYLVYTDWQEESQSTSYLKKYCADHDLDIDEVISLHRRITPREYLISGFYKKLPINKYLIDNKKTEVHEYFQAIFN